MKKMILVTSLVILNTTIPFFCQSAEESNHKDLTEAIIPNQKSHSDKIYGIEQLDTLMLHGMKQVEDAIHKLKQMEHRIEDDIIYHSQPANMAMLTKPTKLLGLTTLSMSLLSFLVYYKSSYTDQKALKWSRNSLGFSITTFLIGLSIHYFKQWHLKRSKARLEDLQEFIKNTEALLELVKKEMSPSQPN